MSENFPIGFNILKLTNLIGVVKYQIIMISFGYVFSELSTYNEIHNEKDNRCIFWKEIHYISQVADKNVAS